MKKVLITGTSRGLGLALSRVFSEAGLEVFGCARGERASDDGATHFTQCDVSDESACSRLFEEVVEAFSQVDCVINNAGVLAPIGFVKDANQSDWRTHLNVNFFGTLTLSKLFIEHLHRTNHRGLLLNLSSGAALKGYAGWGPYCASKAAIDRLSECIQLEESDRLRVHSIAPGVIDTDMQALIRHTSEEKFPARKKFIQLKKDNAFSSADYVAKCFLDVVLEKTTNPNVVFRLPSE